MPHKFDGPRAKISRAKSQVVSLESDQRRFFEQNPYEVRMAQFDESSGRYSLRVFDGPAALPTDWGAIIGEIAHDLRSALDGLVWQLIKKDSKIESAKSQFPIFLYGPLSLIRSNPDQRFDLDWWRFDGLYRSHRIALEAHQPYKRGNQGRRNPLFLVHELNRVDKHRQIPVVVPALGSVRVTGFSGGTELRLRGDLRPNAIIGNVRPLPARGVLTIDLSTGQIHTQHAARVDVVITPYTVFGEGCSAVKGLPVIRTLDHVANEVTRVVESFSREFD